MERKRAALYARVSSQAQAEGDKVSLDEQYREMEARCTDRGYEVVARYQDVASGSTRNRPRFQQMLADARDGLFDIIMCWKSDRLSRGIFPAAALMEVTEATGVELEAVVDQIDEKLFSFYASIGKLEIDNFRERATMGKRGAARRGRWPVGNPPYGYRKGADGRPEIDPAEAEWVKEVFRRYTEVGHGSKQIADWLTETGAPRRRGSKWGHWHTSEVLVMLSRPAYRGEAFYGKRRYRTTQSGVRVTGTPRHEWIGVPFPPLVSAEVWDAVQALKRSRTVFGKRNTKMVHLLQGLASCGECGQRFRVLQLKRSKVRRNGKTYEYTFKQPIRYYKCAGMLEHGLKCRVNSHIRADVLETTVWDEVVRVLRDPGLITKGVLTDIGTIDHAALDAEVTRSRTELARVESEEDRLLRLFVSGKINEAQMNRQRKFITERLEQARASLGGALGRQKAARDASVSGAAVKAWAARIAQGIDNLRPDERQQLIRLVLHHVSVNREGAVRMTLAVPAGDFMADAQPVSS